MVNRPLYPHLCRWTIRPDRPRYSLLLDWRVRRFCDATSVITVVRVNDEMRRYPFLDKVGQTFGK